MLPLAASGHSPLLCWRQAITRPDLTVIAAFGEMDLSTSPDIEHAITPCLLGGATVLLDLAAVTFFDCAALRVVQGAWRLDPRFALLAPSGPVCRVLSLAGVEEVPRFDSIGQAPVSAADADPVSG
jgi:anti-anti-sigma factor